MSDLDTGAATRREVLGAEHVERAAVNAGEFGAPFQDFITRYAWGAVWSRPGIDRRMRSAITLAALVSVRAENELAMHVRAALRQWAHARGDPRDPAPHCRVRRGAGGQLGLRDRQAGDRGGRRASLGRARLGGERTAVAQQLLEPLPIDRA